MTTGKSAEIEQALRADYPRLFEILDQEGERYALRDEVESALRELMDARQYIRDSYRHV